MLDLFALEMSIHGWIALVIAVIGVVALHLVLMYLATRRDRAPSEGPEPRTGKGIGTRPAADPPPRSKTEPEPRR